MIIFATVGNQKYAKTPLGTQCTDENVEISNESECKQAGESLGLQWGKSWDGPNDFPACLYADDARKKVYFNLSPTPDRRQIHVYHSYSAICEVKGTNTICTRESSA